MACADQLTAAVALRGPVVLEAARAADTSDEGVLQPLLFVTRAACHAMASMTHPLKTVVLVPPTVMAPSGPVLRVKFDSLKTRHTRTPSVQAQQPSR
jgi:hypothetical protein